MLEYRYIDREETQAMNILQKHTAQFFGETRIIKRSGKAIYKARGGNNSEFGLYTNGKQLSAMDYSAQRKAEMSLLNRVLYR